jgi:two-component system response regulator RegA
MIAANDECRSVGAPRLLIVDDNETFLRTLERSLLRRGWTVSTATCADEALNLVRQDPPERVVLDLSLGKDSGLQLIPRLLELHPPLRIVVLTGYASIATAVEAMRLGAANYLPKPAETDEILASFEVKSVAGVSEAVVPMSVRQMEWEHLQRVLLEHDGNISATARVLGLHRRSLQRKLRKHAPA